MINRKTNLTIYSLFAGLGLISLCYNFYFYQKILELEQDAHLLRCGISSLQFEEFKQEIKRLESNSLGVQ